LARPVAEPQARRGNTPAGKGGIGAGESFTVQADVVASGLYLTMCEVGTKFAENGREVRAEIKLTEPGSVTIDRCESGFA